MKLSIFLALVSTAAAFAPSSKKVSSTALNAEPTTRKAFLASAAAFIPAAAVAGTMDQENVSDPTEQWETGSPTAAAESARMARFQNARNQLNSNFAPIKRLTLERKSPVTRLDINAPNFEAYKKTYPGLYKTAGAPAVVEEEPAAEEGEAPAESS